MSPPHLASKIPWNGLLEHIQFAPEPTPAEPRRPRLITDMGKPFPCAKPDFQVHPTSNDATRQTATVDFARAFVSLIVEHANARTSILPKPDAWHTSGLVDDEQLFPPSLISKMFWGNIIGNYSTLRAWSISGSPNRGANALFLIIFALNYPENPYEYLPTMLYLAQHPRVSFSESQDLRPLGHGLAGLGAYASQTIARYLFVNLMDAMSGLQGTQKRILGFTQQERAWHVAAVYRDKTIADERLHLPFWISNPNSVYDAAERQRYLDRCFHFMVSWYAIMREAAVRDWALGVTEVPAFGENEFIKMVLDELELICSAFKVDAPPLMLAPPMVDVVEAMDLKLSPFMSLPLELHIHILSFLPRRTLLSVVRVSRQLRTVCTPILYADPLSAILPQLDFADKNTVTAFDLALQNRVPRLISSLASNSSTSKSLRCLHIAVPALDFWGAAKASFLQDLLGDVPLEDVRELWVYPNYSTRHPEWDDPSPGQAYRHGVYDFACLFPGLSTLSLIALERGTLHLGHGDELQHCSALPPLWKSLRRLTVRLEPVHRDVYRHVIASSASTLQSLHIDMPEALLIEEDEWRRFPVCPNVRELTIFHKSPGVQVLLLRCFPSLISLNMKYGPMQDGTLDLAVSAPRLEHVQFMVMCLGTRLPSTVKTVSVRRRIYCEAGGGGLGQPEAVLFGPGLLGTLSENVRFVGEAWPGLRSMEIGGSVDVDKLRTLIATHLPWLEILIFSVHKWSNRPRRMDYPVDDGFDEEQRECAVRFFEMCKGLRVISFNGIPGEDKKGKVPDRVWTRADWGSAARMTVGSALEWRVSEDWRRSESGGRV